MQTLVSIILAVRNGEPFLNEAVESIVNQTYPHWELIVIDDGSTDNTAAIVTSFNDHRIRLFQQQNRGLASSLNRAASLANGELLVRQDADDVSLPDRLEKLVAAFEFNRNVAIIASDAMIIDERGETLIVRQVARNKATAVASVRSLINPFVHGSLAFPRKAFEAAGGYDETLPTSQDFDLIFRLLANGDLSIVEEPLYKLRLHCESVTSKKWRTQVLATCRVALGSSRRAGIKIPFTSISKLIIHKTLTALALIGSNSLSVHRYRIGCLYTQKGDIAAACQTFSEALIESPLFFLCRIKKFRLANHKTIGNLNKNSS